MVRCCVRSRNFQIKEAWPALGRSATEKNICTSIYIYIYMLHREIFNFCYKNHCVANGTDSGCQFGRCMNIIYHNALNS